MSAINLHKVLARFNGNSPATHAEIARLASDSQVTLPTDYVEFLNYADGGEGFIGDAYAIFWRIGEIHALNKEYEVAEYAPGLMLFGSDGGGEAFAFDCRAGIGPVVSVPFVGMELSLARPFGNSFGAFLTYLMQS